MIKRYDANLDCAGLFWVNDLGEWVSYDDHERVVKELQARLEALESEMQEQCRIIGMSAEREDKLMAKVKSLEKDAARYRWLRDQHWSNKGMCVVYKAENVRLGSFCPSGDLLDAHIDAAMKG